MARTQVQSELLATNSISGTIIADNAITATHIATNAISGTLIQDSGIVTTMIAANNITATKVVTNAIQTRHIADDQVTEDKLANAINTSIAAKLPLAGGTMTGALDLDGQELKLDADADTSITADTDDVVDFKVGGTDRLRLAGNNLFLNGATDARVQLGSGGAGANQVSNNTVHIRGDGVDAKYMAASGGDHIFESNGGHLVTMKDSGKVGIGVTDPAQKLEVAGRIRATTDPTFEAYEASGKRGGVQWDATNDFLKMFSVGGDIIFESQNNSGNVGIGITSPTSVLHVAGNSAVITLKDTNGSGNAATPYVLFEDSGATDLGYVGYGSGSNSNMIVANYANADMQFLTNSETRLTIAAEGNVGIGNTTPDSYYSNSNQLVVGSGAARQGITIASSTSTIGQLAFADGTSGDTRYEGSVLYNHNDNHMELSTNHATRIYIDSSGNVGINNNSPAQKLHVGGGVRFSTTPTDGNETRFNFGIGGAADDPTLVIYRHDGSSESVRFQPGSHIYFENKLVVGQTSTTGMSGNGIESNGSIRANNFILSTDLAGSGFRNLNSSANGTITNSTSLRELKENIVDMSLGLSDVLKLKPREFDWKDAEEHGTEDIGFIADEVFDVSPKLATYKVGDKTKDNLQGVKYDTMTSLLVKAIQELEARIKTLEG